MLRAVMGVASGTLTATCVVPYLRDIRRGSTRPQRTTWLIFAAISAVAAISQALAGGGAGMWLGIGAAVGFSAVFAASISHGVGGWSVLDAAVIAVAGAGVVASVVATEPLVALVAVVVAEQMAVALTAQKASDDPASETRSTWAIDCAAGLVAIAAVPELSIAALLYPVHHTVANATVLLAIAVGRRRGRTGGSQAPISRAPGAAVS